MTEQEVEDIIVRTLARMGFHNDELSEIRKDQAFVRRFRVSTEQMTSAGKKAGVTVIVSGVLGLIWLGVQMLFQPK